MAFDIECVELSYGDYDWYPSSGGGPDDDDGEEVGNDAGETGTSPLRTNRGSSHQDESGSSDEEFLASSASH